MAFPCPICGDVANTRSSRMLSATTKETYYNCRNDECCHQFKTMEGDPVTLALPINGGQSVPIALQRKPAPATKKREEETATPGKGITTVTPGRVINILAS